MMRRLSFPPNIYASLIIAPLIFLTAPSVYSEDVAMPVGTQGTTNIQIPGRAWTQDKVVQNFGSPISRRGPVGDPPISTWEYDQFSVYFEGDRVIHSVKRYSASN